MKNHLAPRQQVVGDNSAVAAPPDSFGAHHGAAVFPAQPNKLIKASLKCFCKRVIGIIMETLILPEAVNRGISLLAFVSQAAELFNELVADIKRSKAQGQVVLIVLRVGARSGHMSYVCHMRDTGRLQQFHELWNCAGGMANRKERKCHSYLPACWRATS